MVNQVHRKATVIHFISKKQGLIKWIANAMIDLDWINYYYVVKENKFTIRLLQRGLCFSIVAARSNLFSKQLRNKIDFSGEMMKDIFVFNDFETMH